MNDLKDFRENTPELEEFLNKQKPSREIIKYPDTIKQLIKQEIGITKPDRFRIYNVEAEEYDDIYNEKHISRSEHFTLVEDVTDIIVTTKYPLTKNGLVKTEKGKEDLMLSELTPKEETLGIVTVFSRSTVDRYIGAVSHQDTIALVINPERLTEELND